MRQWLRGPGSTIAAVLGFVTVLGTILGWAFPSLRSWLFEHPTLGWTLAAIAATIGVCAYLWTDKKAQQLEDKIEEIIRERDDLKNRLNPSVQDQELFTAVLDRFPWERGIIFWLATSFNAKSWSESLSTPLHEFNDMWGVRFFDDAAVQSAYLRFRDATMALGNWMALEGAPDGTLGEGSARYSILDGNRRPGGWAAFSEERRRAEQMAAAILEERKHFEEVGRERGLRPPLPNLNQHFA